MTSCNRRFYSRWQVLRRIVGNVLRRRPLISLASNLSYRNNIRLTQQRYDRLSPPTGGPRTVQAAPA